MQFPIHMLKGKRMQIVLGYSIEGRLHGLTCDVLVSNQVFTHIRFVASKSTYNAEFNWEIEAFKIS